MSGDKDFSQFMIVVSYIILVILFHICIYLPFPILLYFLFINQSNNFSIVRQAEYSILQIKIVHHTKLYLLR